MFQKVQIPLPQIYIFGIVAIILAIPAFFINLGITPLIEDEAIRSLVAFEMDQTGNYLVPTVGGSLYYNKPPLFNWIILPFFKAGGFNELMLRIPVVISLLFFALTIFIALRKHVSNRVAFTTALIFLTCGRIITYESLKGLIDIMFSWVLFLNFMTLYNGVKYKMYFKSFFISYLMLVIAFMLKGLPALVFQAITIFSLYYIHHKWRMFSLLFSFKHFLGILIFLLLIASYYLAYLKYNPGNFNEMVSVVFQQSAKRTVVQFGVAETIKHFFTYPFEFIGHFMPWTLLIIYVFSKRGRFSGSQTFIQSCFWVFLLNILVYWTSPQSYARYVLMLVPLAYLILVFYYEKNYNAAIGRVLYYAFLVIMAVCLIATLTLPFLSLTNIREMVWFKALFLFLAIGAIVYFYLKQPRNMLILTAIFILVLRIAFDWFVLTHRIERMGESGKKEEAVAIGKFARDKNIFVYAPSHTHFDEDKHKKQISFFSRYYISVHANKIVCDTQKIIPGAYYLVRPQDLKGLKHQKIPGMNMTHEKEPRVMVYFIP